jgi:tetratricopeptide (TPR) repeat protein
MRSRFHTRLTLMMAFLVFACATLVAQTTDPRDDFAAAADFGRRFFEAGNFSAALTWLEKADSIIPDQPAVLYDAALVLVRLQRYDDAQRKLDRYVVLYPQGHELQAAKSLQRELQFGIEVRRRERQDTEYRTLFSRAKALYAKGLRRESLDAFRQAEQLYADDPVVDYNEALLYEEDGAFEEALRAYNRYLQSSPANAPQMQAHIIDLEHEIGDMRTKLLCPVCGAKLSAGARWCHRCWHGPYDVTSAAWNARACDAHVGVTRSVLDVSGKRRISEPLECLFPGRSLQDFLHYSPMTQAAVREARASEGWVATNDGVLQSRRTGAGAEVVLQQSDHLQRLEIASTGELFPYTSHATGDGVWLLDAQPFATSDQLFSVQRTFDNDGRILREEVAYDSTRCRHAVMYTVTYTYKGGDVIGAQISGSYEGYRVEGYPKTHWDATISRTFDENSRLTHEELNVTAYEKTFAAKPQGKVSNEVRQVYQTLKPRRPIDIRMIGDTCGLAAGGRLDEPIDLRPLFLITPALAMQLKSGDAKVAVDYVYK